MPTARCLRFPLQGRMSRLNKNPDRMHLAHLFPKNLEGQMLNSLKNAPQAYQAVKQAFKQAAGKNLNGAQESSSAAPAPVQQPRQVVIIQPPPSPKSISGAELAGSTAHPILIVLLIAALGLTIGLALALLF